MQLNTSNSAFYSAILVLFLAFGTASAQVIYVSEGATGNGSSWQNASGNLRLALASAQDGEEVWVSSGTYTPTTCSPCMFSDRDMRFVLPKGVKLLGGFVGNELTANDRPNGNSSSNATVILSGQIEPGVNTSRSFTVLEAIAPTIDNHIEYIQFENALADDTTRGNSNQGASGALLYITSYDTLETINLTLDNCSFENGDAIGYGGAVFVNADFHKQSKLQVTNCDFRMNSAETGGGAMSISSNFEGFDNSTFFNCDFIENEAGSEGGGGVLVRAANDGISNAHFDEVNFRDNHADLGEGGGLRLYGNSGDCSPILTNTIFEENSAHFGGGLHIDGAFGGKSNPSLTNCTLRNNSSGNAGGAIYASAVFGGTADFEIYQSEISSNYSGESGGAILVNAIEGSSRAHYRDVQFTDNEAFYYGGAVYNLGKAGVCSPTFINCIIANNKGASAGGVYCLGSEGGESSPIILNCVFEGNEALVGGGLYSNGNDETGTAEPFVANTVFLNNKADNGRTLRIIHAKPRLLNCYFDESDCTSLNSGFGGEPICLGGNQYNTADVFDRTGQPYEYKALSNASILDAGSDSVLIANLVFNDITGGVRFRGSTTDIGPTERSSDPILLKLTVDSASVSVCEGDELTLNASLYPPYPTAQISWKVAGTQVNQGDSYTISTVVQPLTIQVEGTFIGETRATGINVAVVPMIQTSLQTDASSLPDPLCLDSTYQLQATVIASDADYFVEWLDENENILSQAETLAFTPNSLETSIIKVKASFVGNCLDETTREESYVLEVINCATSSTRQASNNETLTVYPNPASNIFNIQGIPENKQSPIKIYSSTGQIVYSGMVSASSTSINVSSLPQGLYAIIVLDEQIIYRVLLEKL